MPHVLYVEDNQANINLMASIFEALGSIRLSTAETVEHGYEMCCAEKPNLLLIDISLPDGDGFELLEKIREQDSLQDIPAFAVTANATKQDIAKGLAAGFEMYITKPINIQNFCETVKAKLFLKPNPT